jgi:quercetin dioxygenase-like cupin family protein
MPGKFILMDDVRRDELDIVRLGWLSHPASTGASKFTVLEGTFFPGKGHSFHYHADQEELIYVVSGTVEHWIKQEKRILGGTVKLTREDEAAAGTARKPVQINPRALSLSHRAK